MTLSERTPDGLPRVWTLLRPESATGDGVFVRRCDVFSSEARAKGWLDAMLGRAAVWRRHPLFPELQVTTSGRGLFWYLTPAPLDPPTGGR